MNVYITSTECLHALHMNNLSTYLFQLFGNKGRVFPQFGSEALCQDQRVEQSRKTSLGRMAEKL